MLDDITGCQLWKSGVLQLDLFRDHFKNIMGIIVIGGMTHLSGDQIILPAVAVLIATVNMH